MSASTAEDVLSQISSFELFPAPEIRAVAVFYRDANGNRLGCGGCSMFPLESAKQMVAALQHCIRELESSCGRMQ